MINRTQKDIEYHQPQWNQLNHELALHNHVYRMIVTNKYRQESGKLEPSHNAGRDKIVQSC
jgi:hypothetical protein